MDNLSSDHFEVWDDEVKKLYHQKNYMIGKIYGDRFVRLEVEDFFRLVFGRDDGDLTEEVLPFESELCQEYLIWRSQKERKVAKIDYSGCAKRLYNGLVLYRGLLKQESEEKKKNGEHLSEGDYRHHTGIILLDDHGELKMDRADRFMSSDWALTYPVTFVGKRPIAKYARYLYGFVIDLDGVGMREMGYCMNFFFERTMEEEERGGTIGHYGKEYYNRPNIIVNSGHGLHLYFLLDKPVAMFPDNCAILARIKRALIQRFWNGFTSNIETRQYQGIYQGYRVPGTRTKFGEEVIAWQVCDRDFYTLEELNLYLSWKIDNGKMLLSPDEIQQLKGNGGYSPLKVTMEEAQRRWPDWYQRIVVHGEKKGQWKVSRRLYDWFLRQLKFDQIKDVTVGHRYHCIRCLAAIAWKCRYDVVENKGKKRERTLKGVSIEELRKDAYSLLESFERITVSEDNHFTSADIEAALLGYGENMFKLTKQTLAELTALKIPVGQRRNGRNQQLHLKRARTLRDLDREEPWYKNGGCKVSTPETSKIAHEVYKWQLSNPNKNRASCAKDLRLDFDTVCKWWVEEASCTIPQQIAAWRDSHPESTNKSACARDLGLSHPTVRKWWNRGMGNNSDKI